MTYGQKTNFSKKSNFKEIKKLEMGKKKRNVYNFGDIGKNDLIKRSQKMFFFSKC